MIRKIKAAVDSSGVVLRLLGPGATRISLSVVLGLAGVLATGPVLAQATFTPLGLFGGSRSEAYDVSADGSVVVGESFFPNGQQNLFRWTAEESMVRSGGSSHPPAVSADGSVVVGGSRVMLGSGIQAFRWHVDGAFETLGDFAGGPPLPSSAALDVSADGSVVVGFGSGPTGTEAFRWTEATGMVSLDELPGFTQSVARGVSADGNVVVGEEHGVAFRWTAQSGMVSLGRLPGAISSRAHRVSADGSVVVGTNQFRPQLLMPRSEPFRWTEPDGMVGLGDLRGGHELSSIAYDVSADGSVIVGLAETDELGPLGAFYWTAQTGMVNLQGVLVADGVTNLEGWTLTEARGVSADGLTIVGIGVHDGRREAWVATIPEPSTIALAALAALLLALYRRRRRAVATAAMRQ